MSLCLYASLNITTYVPRNPLIFLLKYFHCLPHTCLIALTPLLMLGNRLLFLFKYLHCLLVTCLIALTFLLTCLPYVDLFLLAYFSDFFPY